MKNIIIDVGANAGLFSLEIAKRNPDKDIIAFEPEPTLFGNLIEKSKELSNYKAYQLGIAKESGTAKFHVSKLADWGTSSLLPFNQQHLKEDEYWATRKDLFHCEEIEIEIKSLEDVLDDFEFDEISFVKIDAQGFDLDVLKSSGKYLSKIQMGMLEVASVKSTSLYEGEYASLIDVLNFCEENLFEVYAIKPNDYANNECNVFFVKKGLNYRELEYSCHLKNLKLYDGKNYWYHPSSTYAPYKIEDKILKKIDSLNKMISDNSTKKMEDKILKKIDSLNKAISDNSTKMSEYIYIYERNLTRLENKLRKMSFEYKCRKLIACFIPSKELRRKIRGDK